jgi:hypothetical protein
MAPEALYDHFARISRSKSADLFPLWLERPGNPSDPVSRPIELEEVQAALAKTNPSSAPGPDGISPLLVKQIFNSSEMHLYLMRLFNRCFDLSVVPREWTLFEMFVLYKGKGPLDVGDSY